MALTSPPRIRMPATAKAGEVVEVKTLIGHEMESGQRRDGAGRVIPRKILRQFTLTFNGRELLSAELHPAVSANPYQAFHVRITETGVFRFVWLDDDGTVHAVEHKVTVV